MAAPRPKPMVPSPPLERKRRGVRIRKYCAAHIWCCPTSVATGVAGPRRRFTASRTFFGVMPGRWSAL